MAGTWGATMTGRPGTTAGRQMTHRPTCVCCGRTLRMVNEPRGPVACRACKLKLFRACLALEREGLITPAANDASVFTSMAVVERARAMLARGR